MASAHSHNNATDGDYKFMDLTQARNGLRQLQHDASSSNIDFQKAYENAQAWIAPIRQQNAFQPLKEGETIPVRPFALLTLENDIESLLEALQNRDLESTQQACTAALSAIKRPPLSTPEAIHAPRTTSLSRPPLKQRNEPAIATATRMESSGVKDSEQKTRGL